MKSLRLRLFSPSDSLLSQNTRVIEDAFTQMDALKVSTFPGNELKAIWVGEFAELPDTPREPRVLYIVTNATPSLYLGDMAMN